MGGRPLVVGVTDIRRQPGTRRPLQRGVVLPGLGISSAHVPEGAEIGLDLQLEQRLRVLDCSRSGRKLIHWHHIFNTSDCPIGTVAAQA